MARATRWERTWFGDASLVRLAAFRIIVLVAAFYGIWHFRVGVFQHADGVHLGYLARTWNPIYAFEVLGLRPPGPVAVRVVYAALLASLALGIAGLFTRTCCALVALLTFYWLGVHYSFGQPHHDCVQLMFALLALPFAPVGARLSLDSLRARLRRARAGGDPTAAPERGAWAALPLRITMVSLALGYFFSGATKIAISGLGWANGYTLQGIMLEYRSPWSDLLSERVWLCQLMQAGLLFAQASFPLVFLAPLLRWFYVPMAVLFHLLAMQTMATGPFITLWFMLAAFVPLERVPAFLGRNIARGSWLRRLVVGGALAALSWTALALYFRFMPKWMLFLLLPLGLALFLGCVSRWKLEVAFDPASAAARRAVALLDALDWSGRLAFVPDPGGPSFRARTATGRELVGRAAWRAALRRTPLGLPFSWLARAP